MQNKTEESSIVAPHPSQSKLIGHQDLLDKITKIVRMEKSHHAIMLTGKKGIGKATILYEALKIHLAECDIAAGKDRNSIAMLLAGTHPDVFVIEASLSKTNKEDISIDQIRTMIEFARLTPSYLDRKYIIIDPIDALNHNSANALLKILEEPPSTVRFLMTCSNPNMAINTITSRCIALHCKSNSSQNCIQILENLGLKENLPLIAKISENNVSLAIDIIRSGALSFYQALLHDINSLSNTCEKLLPQGYEGIYYPDLLKHFVQRICITLCKMSAGFINPSLLADFETDPLEKYLNTKYSTPLEISDKMNRCSQLLYDSEIFNLGEVHLTQALLAIMRQ